MLKEFQCKKKIIKKLDPLTQAIQQAYKKSYNV